MQKKMNNKKTKRSPIEPIAEQTMEFCANLGRCGAVSTSGIIRASRSLANLFILLTNKTSNTYGKRF